MSTFDVRDNSLNTITSIVFAGPHHEFTSALTLDKDDDRDGCVKIMDEVDEFVILCSEQDARNLITAINKAIELKWFDK